MTDADPKYEHLRGELIEADAESRPALRQQMHSRYLELERGGVTSSGLPYPSPDDPLSEGADAIRALAEAIGPQLEPVERIADELAAATPNALPGRLVRYLDPPAQGQALSTIAVGTPQTANQATPMAWVLQQIAAAGGGGSQQANGPTSTAYNRNAVGSGWFTTWMNSALQFMRNTSSRRYKEDIRTAEGLDAAVDALRSGRVRWRQYHRIGQPDGTVELGLIAEECVDIPHLVAWDQTRDPETNEVFDEEWRPEAVRYETVLPVYLLEIVQRQNAELIELRARVDELAGR